MSKLVADAFAAHRPFVERRLRALGVPADAVEDAAQEVFTVLVRRANEFRSGGSVRAYLSGICRGVASNARRGAARRRNALQRFAEFCRRDGHDGPSLEAGIDLAGALGGLNPDLEAVTAARMEGLTAREIGHALELPTSTVQWRLRMARERLRQILVHAGERVVQFLVAVPGRLGQGAAPACAGAMVVSVLALTPAPTPDADFWALADREVTLVPVAVRIVPTAEDVLVLPDAWDEPAPRPRHRRPVGRVFIEQDPLAPAADPPPVPLPPVPASILHPSGPTWTHLPPEGDEGESEDAEAPAAADSTELDADDGAPVLGDQPVI